MGTGPWTCGHWFDSQFRQKLCLSQHPSSLVSNFDYRVTFSMGHAGANRKSPNGASWEMLSQRCSRPISTSPGSGHERKIQSLTEELTHSLEVRNSHKINHQMIIFLVGVDGMKKVERR